MDEKMTPRIRFKGFKDDWERRKLGEVVNVNSGKDYKHLNKGKIPVYGTGGYMLSVDSFLSEEDGIGIGRKGTINSPYILKAPYWTVDTLFYVIPKKNYNLAFVYSIFQKINWKLYDESTGVPSLSKQTINAIDVTVPIFKEQEKIGSIFQTLDTLIASNQKKLDNLQMLKKLLMQKIFDQEWRFKGFTDPWERRNLGDVVENQYNGQTPSRNNPDFWGGEIPWLTSGELNHGIVNNTVETITVAGQKDANLKIVPAGTFVMAITGLEAPGTRGNSSILGFDTTVNQSVMALFPNEKLDTQFLFQWYQKVGEEYGISYTQGTKQQSYNAELIKILPFTLPDNVEEQQRIAKLLFKLDDLIASNQQHLNQLKTLKKYLMQNMFV